MKNFVKIVVLAVALTGVFYLLSAKNIVTPHSGGASVVNFVGKEVKNENLEALPLTKIKECLNRAGKTGDCLDKLFGEYLKNHTTKGALAVLQNYEDNDLNFRYSCHPVVHAVGHETFKIKKTIHDSFQACDQTCHSGCYHGAMERFLRGGASDDEDAHISEDELKNKVAAACDPNQPSRFRFQCLHGLGHALVFFLNYKLEKSLGGCDLLGDQWSKSSCYGGAFMENVFAADPTKRDLSKTDYHYPCNKLDKKYKYDCYIMQTTRMSEMGLTTDELFKECKNAGSDFRQQCIQSIGRDLSNEARVKPPEETAKKCEMVAGEDRKSCIKGVIYALIDNTWDGKYAYPFCASFSSFADSSFCFGQSGGYFKSIYSKTNQETKAECDKYLKYPWVCRFTAI